MNKLIQKSWDTMKDGVDSLKNIKKDKEEYRQHLARVKALPKAHHYVYDKIIHYMWSLYGGGSGYDLIEIQKDLLELFEMSVLDNKTVTEVTGDDVAYFCDELLRSTHTYTQKQYDKLNSDIHKKLQSM